jgi:hypothetical protein
MDFLRACYVTKMRLHTDPSILTTVRWFKCRVGAPPLGFPTPFVSLNWRTDPFRESPLGEVYGEPRPFNHGRTPLGAVFGAPCGDPQWFRTGEPYPNSLPPAVYDTTGMLACCTDRFRRLATGGAVAGGTATVTLSPTVTSTGGAVAGGTAEVDVTGVVASTGGAAAGGTAEVDVDDVLASTGGAVGGGKAFVNVTGGYASTYGRRYGEGDVYQSLVALDPDVNFWSENGGPVALFKLYGPSETGVDGYWIYTDSTFGGYSGSTTGWDGLGTREFFPNRFGVEVLITWLD